LKHREIDFEREREREIERENVELQNERMGSEYFLILLFAHRDQKRKC